MALGVQFKVEAKGFINADKELVKLGKKAGIKAQQITDELAKVTLRAVIRNTQPFGLGGKAKKAGEGAILSDMIHAFKVVSNGFSNDPDVVNSESEAVAHLRRVGMANKRVKRSVMFGSQRRKITVSVFKSLEKKLTAKVGSAKGGWSAKARALGVKTQRWISRHSDKGSAKRRRVMGGAEWKFKAEPTHLKYARVLGEVRLQRVLNGQGAKNLRRAFNAKIAAELRKTQRKVNS